MHNLLKRSIAMTAISLSLVAVLFSQDGLETSIVKIYTVTNRHSYLEPWQLQGQKRVSGSGCIINGGRILTNAHVVADGAFIQVKRAGTAKKYVAEVEIVAHECDLAILRVKDSEFFEKAQPIEIGEMVSVKDQVDTFGFPEGGEELAVTQGVVSRVEIQEYTHSQAKLLSCQIDAAINPGSSGGPVIKNNKIAGVAFEAGGGENIGYMVPVVVINHFLKDSEDGHYDGFPGLEISWQTMENPALREKYAMNIEQTGIMVNKIYPGSPAKGILEARDIMLAIDGVRIANDGTVEFRKNERTGFEYLIQNKYINDTARLLLLRKGQLMNVDVKLTIPSNFSRLVPHNQYDIPPTYYLVGGLIFQQLSYDYIYERIRSDDHDIDSYINLISYHDVGEPTEDRRELVVLASVLADEVNIGYQNLESVVISSANGQKISTFKDFVKAVEQNREKFHVFVDEQGKEIVLERVQSEHKKEIILKKYSIRSDRSEDLTKKEMER